MVTKSAARGPAELLTLRQLEVLELLARGLTNREIAGVLAISAATVKNHVSAIIAALDVGNRTEAAFALQALGGARSQASLPAAGVPGFGDRPAIAVLAFEDLSAGRSADAHLGDALAEDLITRLSAWRWFPVIARSSSFAYRGEALDATRASRELGARYLVEGSVRVAGEQVRVTAQLIDGATGTHLWAERYDRVYRDVLALQDEIVAAIVSALEPTLIGVGRIRAQHRPVQDLSAWELFERGLHYQWRQKVGDLELSEPLLRRALELDPELAPAWAALGAGLALRLTWGMAVDRSATLQAAIDCSRRAVELDPQDGAGHAALGGALALARQRDAALRAFERALEVNPSSAPAAYGLGGLLMRRETVERAIEAYRRAIALSPRDALLHFFEGSLACALTLAGRHEQALEHARRSVEVEPSGAFSFRPLVIAILAHAGRLDEARAARDALMAVGPVFSREVLNQIASAALREHLLAGFALVPWDPFTEAPWHGPQGKAGAQT
jgi:TolB-like protein/DNA-binding CsgD family transcriptional regulator/Flp pilus assembly protein TadD